MKKEAGIEPRSTRFTVDSDYHYTIITDQSSNGEGPRIGTRVIFKLFPNNLLLFHDGFARIHFTTETLFGLSLIPVIAQSTLNGLSVQHLQNKIFHKSKI